MTADIFGRLLCHFLTQFKDKKFVIFRDNARIHRSQVVKKMVSDSGLEKQVRFETLPAYSPELNPVELWNNEYKAALKKMSCQDSENVLQVSRNFADKFQDKQGSTTYGRRKARQYFKGEHTFFIYETYVRALISYRKEEQEKRRSEKAQVA